MKFPASAERQFSRQHTANLPSVVQWEASLGDPEIPGLGSFAAAKSIPASKQGKITTLGADRISNLTVRVAAAYNVQAGDKLDGAEVLEVVPVNGPSTGDVLWRMCYARA